MYTMMDQIPASVIFNKLQKLKKPAFSWAPRSLLGVQNPVDLSNRSAARCDADGLHVQFAGYIVRTALSVRRSLPEGRDRVFIGDVHDSFPKAMITPESGSDHRKVYLSTVDFERLIKTIPAPAIIINPQDSNESALVSVVSEDGEVIRAEFLRRIQARFWSTASSFNAKVYGGWRDGLMAVQEISANQKWCIR